MSLSGILEIATHTDTGMVRNHNEDRITGDADHGIAVLADGMGGYNAGEVASGIAVAMLGEGLKAVAQKFTGDASAKSTSALIAAMVEEVNKTNSAIYQTAQTQPQCAGMGTTLVVVMFHDNRIIVTHVGDSRLYRLRNEKLEQITRDHSLLQEQIDSGMITAEDARLSHNKNLVTKALGIDPSVEAEIREYDAMPGDIYLLCSDGLNDMVEDSDIELTLNAMGSNLDLAAHQLVQMANDNGGRDNVSVILIKVLREFSVKSGWFARVMGWLKK